MSQPKYRRINYGEALNEWRAGATVYAAFDDGDPNNGVISLYGPGEFAEFSDVLFVEELP